MKNRKAAGPDGLNSELFKYGGPILSNRLLKLINKCWTERLIPEEWRQARVKSVFKKGRRDDSSNYRGISPLNSGYKIYTKIITHCLKTSETHPELQTSREKKIVDARGKDGNASMPEQVRQPNPWRKMIIDKIKIIKEC
jgi:hypothetical protein